MPMMTRTCLSTVAAVVLSLPGGLAAAQDADTQAQVEDLHQRYEAAMAAGDWEAVGSLFAENAIMLPMTGGMLEGRDAVQSAYGEFMLGATDVRSSRTEAISDNLILDIGTWTSALAEEAGGGNVEGEYVALAEPGDNGLQIRSLTIFPIRQAPEAPAQQ